MGDADTLLLKIRADLCHFELQYMKKLNRQERVVEEVKLAIKPHYSKGRLSKTEYKEILRKAVPKVKMLKPFISSVCNKIFCTCTCFHNSLVSAETQSL